MALNVTGELSLGDVTAALDAGYRVLLMVRHAERPKIDNDDPTFGAALPLTADGIRMSRDFGALLRAYAPVTQFYASPLRRTRMTAQAIAEGMGLAGASVPTDDILGNGTPYFADAYAVFKLFQSGGFFSKTIAYAETGRQEGFADLHAATEKLEAWCLKVFTARLGIFTTHDLYDVAFLSAKSAGVRFTRENWTRFLDSAAIFIAPDASRTYALVRAGLSDGICGV